MDYTIRTTKQQYTNTPLVLSMFGIGHEQEKVNRPRGIALWQILYGVSGSGKMRIEGRNYLLHEGEMALLPPHIGHQYEKSGDSWTVHFLGFGGNSCQKILFDLKLREPGVYHHRQGRGAGGLSRSAEITAHLTRFKDILSGGQPAKHRLLSKELYALLLDLAEGSTRSGFLSAGGEDELATEVIGFLEEHFSEDIALSALAEEFGLTPEYLCARFKKRTGETIITSLRRIRVGHARMILMEHPEKPLREVGEMCGFRSASYFGKIFREQTGVTPQNFRTLR